MSGPTQQQNLQWVVPPGEAQVQFAPSALAYLIQNFEETPEGTLKTIRGPAPYERAGPQGYFNLGEPHGIFHALLNNGQSDMLLVRAGTVLYRHAGWTPRSYESLQTGLSSDRRSEWPDQFALLADKVIWCNGIDSPLIIAGDGTVIPLGFASAPTMPQVDGPVQPGETEKSGYYPNSQGYSWPGRIGTTGDLIDGVTGSLLSGAWYYYVQWEDMYGNLSPMSPQSNAFVLANAQSNASIVSGGGMRLSDTEYTTCTIDDLLRQSIVHLSGSAPTHAVAIRILRTEDTKRVGTQPRLLTRFGNTDAIIYPDQAGDGELGPVEEQKWAVKPWRVMCVHQGRLVIGNVQGDPGVVRESEPGFPGTFLEKSWTYPDQGSAEVTAVVSHLGFLLAFTDSGAYNLQDFGNPSAIGRGTGCVAPRSIASMPDGSLIWLGRDGVYRFDGKSIAPLAGPIHDTIEYGINRGRMRMASAVVDPISREYRLAIGKAGSNRQTLVLCYGTNGFRRFDFENIHIADWCVTNDWRRYVLAIGRDMSASQNHIFAMDREVAWYDPPTRTNIYRTGWMRADKTASEPVNVRTIYIGMVDAWAGTVEVRFFKNGSWSPTLTTTDLRSVGLNPRSLAGVVVIGTDKVVAERLFWRQLSCENEMRDCFTWAFEVRSTYPAALHPAAFAFDISKAGTGNSRAGRIPRAGDV